MGLSEGRGALSGLLQRGLAPIDDGGLAIRTLGA